MGAKTDQEVVQMLRSGTGVLSMLGLSLALLGLVTVFVSGSIGLGLGIAGLVFSGGSVVQRDGTESTRNVAALGAIFSTLVICIGFVRF